MGLWTAFKETLKGNFSDAANYAFMSEDAITTQREVANHQQALAAKQAAQGIINEDEANALIADIQGSAYPYLFDSYGGPAQVFVDETKKGLMDLPTTFATGLNKTIGGASKFIGRAIPWYIWLIGLIALMVYLAPFLSPILSTYFKRRK